MPERERAKKHFREIIQRKRFKKQNYFESKRNLEINNPSKTSLHFSFNSGKSVPYKPHLTLFENSDYSKKANQMFSEWKHQKNWKRVPSNERKTQLLCLVANILSLPRTSSGRQVRAPLSLAVYQNKRIKEIITFFRIQGYINILPGYSFKSGSHETSKIYPTSKFDDYFNPISCEYEINQHISFQDSELIRIKRNKKKIVLSETNEKRSKWTRNKLIEINKVNLSHEIVTRTSKYEYPCCSKLYAVYNRNLSRGGRLYASGLSYQNDLKANRGSIFIDNEQTIELDYSGLHPRMLYAEEGIQLEGDLYDLTEELPEYGQDQQLRKLSKLALLILINSKKGKNIGGTLANRVWETDSKLCHHLTRYQCSDNEAGIYKRTVDAVIKKHSKISKFFNSDIGIRLQNKDGKMALRVCYSFAKQGIPILPVHDSFIVAEKYEQLLEKTMIESYGKFNSGFSCPISRKV